MKILYSNIRALNPMAILMGRKTVDVDQVGKPARLIKVPKE
jgi:hypothetical protein